MPTSRRGTAPTITLRVHLLNGFRVDVAQQEVMLPAHAQRVLAYLALSRPTAGAPMRRTPLAELLWGDGTSQRAQASLRTSLWRIRQAHVGLVHADRERVHLGEGVEVDVERSLAQADRLLRADRDLEARDTSIADLVADLLPGWEEEWLLLERERIRQVRIHALEALAHRQCRLGRIVPALDAAYAAIAAEPLRESAHASLVEIHLAQGNVVEARRQVDQYARLLWAEMRLRPSAVLVARVSADCAVPAPRSPVHERRVDQPRSS
ncbi:AfsR/SARP family transcriptional regulator [Actinomycetospora aeridis]|uniref:BTAD domain-containing putative transcriptional regulator n=1 Tax=Actinomycetospora aeridis TaxID=3129231 RepID=A0ABU8N251_9PSEU